MPGKSDNSSNFWQELKRRKVLRVITVYAAVAFVILQLVEILAPSLRLPDWTMNFILVVLIVGFIIAIILSWIYDITPEGLEKTKPVHEIEEEVPDKPSAGNAWKIATIISVVVIVGLVVLNISGNRKRAEDLIGLEKSIAVLPFDNMSVDDEYSHMGDAITDEIILELQKIREFRVLSRTSTMQFRDNRPTIPEIAEKLGVNFIIEGSILRHEETVSINVQVIRAKQEDHVWGDEIDGRWEDILPIQDKIALKVANELEAVLSPEEIEHIDHKPTENPQAYNLYLRGMYYFDLHQDFALSAEYFEKAIQMDSTYALAYAYLAQCYQFIGRYSHLPDEDAYAKTKRKAMEAIIKALEQDPSLGVAHATHGLLMAVFDWDIYDAESRFHKAIELSPRNPEVYASYAQYLRWMGRYDESIMIANQALELDPLNPMRYMWLAVFYTYSGKFDSSNQQLEKVLNLNPDQIHPHFVYAYNYAQMEMYDKAIAHADDAMSDGALINDLLNFSFISLVYAKSGLADNTRKQLEQMLELSRIQYVDPVFLAISYVGLGEYENAFSCLSKAFEIHSGQMIYLNGYADFFFEEIALDPRYNELLVKIGFEVNAKQ